MGNTFKNITSIFDQKDFKLLVLGLDNAGKTTIAHQLRLGEYIKTIPNIDFNVEAIETKNIQMIIWDIINVKPLNRYR